MSQTPKISDIIKRNYSVVFNDLIERKSSIKLFSVFDLLIHRKFVIVLISVLLVLGLKSQFEGLLNTLLVNGIYKEIKFNIGFDFVFLLFTLIIITFLAKKASKFYRASFTQLYFCIGLVIIYSYYRIDSNVWVFESFQMEILSSIAYLDILLIPLIYPVAFFIFFHFRSYNSVGELNFFIEDIPIDESSRDRLNRKPYAQDLVQRVVNQKFNKSFSIGILGKWGTGKSSFLLLIQKEATQIKPNTIVVNFNAFYNHDAKDIIREFFTILSLELGVYSGALSNKIIKYRDYLVNLIESGASKSIKELLDLISSEKEQSVFSQYDKVNSELKKLNKQILIFIDDLDRLRHTEIIEILKLIRNTGDFSNTVYFVAFDKDYITKSLEDHSSFNDNKFIQKYFQYEFILPPIKIEILRQRFMELVSMRIKDTSVTEEGTIINPEKYVTSTLFDSQIQTMRDVTRLANIYCFEYQRVSGEVDVNDFTKIMLLKSKYASVYELISHKKNIYIDQKNHALKWQKREDKKVVSLDLEESKHYSTRELSDIDEILEAIFPDSIVDFHPEHLSIRHPKNIDKYFYLNLLSGDISNVEFIESFNSNFTQFELSLLKWMNKGQHYLIINRISVERLDTKIKLYNALNGLIYVAKSNEDYYIHKKVIDTLGDVIDFNRFIKEGFIEGNAEIGQYILDNYLKKATVPYSFEKELIYHIIQDNPSDENIHWGVPLVDYQTIMQNYFDTFLDSLSASTWEVYRLYHKVYDIGVIEPINEKLKAFLQEKDYKQFLSDIIDKDPFEDQYNVSVIVFRIFGSHKEFTAFLELLTESKELAEFKIFNELISYHVASYKIFFNFSVIQLRFTEDTRRFDPDSRKELYLKINNQILYDTIKSDVTSINSNYILHIQVLKSNVVVVRDRSGSDNSMFKKNLVNQLMRMGKEVSLNLIENPSSSDDLTRGDTLMLEDGKSIIEVIWFQTKA